MFTINSIHPNCNNYVSFQGGASKKLVKKAVPFMGVLATGALVNDVFMKTSKVNNKDVLILEEANFKANLQAIPQAKIIIEKMNKRFNIKGNTYKELAYNVKVAAADFKSDAEVDRECKEYDVANRNERHAEEMKYYYNFLKDLASQKYTKEDAKEYNNKIKEYKTLRNKMESILRKNDGDESNPKYQDYELDIEELACWFCNKLYDPEFFI